MVSSDIRKEARESLKGKWGKGALITLVYSLITFVIQFIAKLIPVVGAIALAVIELPITYGIIVSFMKLKRGEEVSVVDFLTDGFKSFGRVWGVAGNVVLKLIIPIVLLIIFIILAAFGGAAMFSGVAIKSNSVLGNGSVLGIIGIIGYIVTIIYLAVKSLYYSLVMYILKDNEELTGKEIVEQSEKLMKGNRWSLVWLSITFIGWAFLDCFTFGIGTFWLFPYVIVAQIVFYEDRAGKLKESDAEAIEEK